MQKLQHDLQMLNMKVISLIRVLYCITVLINMLIDNLILELYSHNIAFNHWDI